ncbi:hypothetical protein ACFY0N_20635 [Streptomyces vinaceus]|uniref:hypothetical protein n=1 Tax=Streptomyces vinaceus TaxID=1960 RepID=UPI0035E3AA26
MHETAPSPTTARAPDGAPAADVVLRWATSLAVALIPVAFVFGALAGMASEVRPRTVAVVTVFWFGSWTATPLLVAAFWLCRRRPALATAARWAGWLATLPPTLTTALALCL